MTRPATTRLTGGGPAAVPAAGAAGFTIMELLVVLAIIGILVGMGAGVFVGLMKAGRFQSTQQQVVNLVRKARNAALGDERAALLVEEDGTSVRAILQKVIGLWHCEDLEGGVTTGADRKDATVHGGELVEEGFLGRAIELTQGWMDGGKYPDYEVTDGVGAELLVRPASRRTMTLVQKGEAFRLWLEPARVGLVARVRIRVGRGAGSRTVLDLRADDAPIPLDRWSRISFRYDRTLATLSVNEIERDRLPEDPELDDGEAAGGPGAPAGGIPPSRREEADATLPIVRDENAHLTIGSPDAPIDGAVDEIRVTGVLSGDIVRLPEDVTIVTDTPTIRFRDNGLDTETHAAPVVLRLLFGENGSQGSRRITIGLNGQPVQR